MYHLDMQREEKVELRKSDLLGVLDQLQIDIGGTPGSGWSVDAIVHETTNPKMVMLEYSSSLPEDADEEELIAEPEKNLDDWIDPLIEMNQLIECYGLYEGEGFFWQVDKWSLCERDAYEEKIKKITFAWTINGYLTQDMFCNEFGFYIDKNDNGFDCSCDFDAPRLLLRNWDGDTFLMYFLRERALVEEAIEESIAGIKYLVHDIGIDVNAKNDIGESALTLAEPLLKMLESEDPESKALKRSLLDILNVRNS
jgi:hypothetical protein